MLMNSPLIPTITSSPDAEGNILNLKYTLPSGEIVYSPQVPVKSANSKAANIVDASEKINSNTIQVPIVNHMLCLQEIKKAAGNYLSCSSFCLIVSFSAGVE